MAETKHLATFRKGWENENLARYLLSRFSFVAEPCSVSDDLGSDFYCTAYQRYEEDGKAYLSPRNTFSIQIKSNAKDICASGHVPYLRDLEIPFFVGVCDQQMASLTIYSGEYTQMLFTQKRDPQKLTIKMCERDRGSYFWESEDRPGSWYVRFPRVGTISCGSTAEEIGETALEIMKICRVVQRNISARASREYSLLAYPEPYYYIFAGSDSIQVFRLNFYRRLAEVFHNLKWLCDSCPGAFSREEFELYDSLVRELCAQYGKDNVLQPELEGPLCYLRRQLASDATR